MPLTARPHRPRPGATDRPPVVELVDDEMVRILAAKTGAERLAMAADALRFAQQLLRGAARQAHPEWDEARVEREVAQRLSGGLP